MSLGAGIPKKYKNYSDGKENRGQDACSRKCTHDNTPQGCNNYVYLCFSQYVHHHRCFEPLKFSVYLCFSQYVYLVRILIPLHNKLEGEQDIEGHLLTETTHAGGVQRFGIKSGATHREDRPDAKFPRR